jgi:CRP-like cAMP-binding protein
MDLRKLKDKATEAFTKGRFFRAAELYEEYCRADPKDHQSRLRTGDAWTKAGQRERAISAYQAAAEGFAKEGFLPRAIAASKLILELDPAHHGVQQMLADLYARRAAPAGARARAPMGSTLPQEQAPQAAPAQAPVAKSRPPDDVRAAMAAIDLDVEGNASEAPGALAADGTPLDLSSELPAELSLSVDAAPRAAGPELEEEFVPEDAARARGGAASEGDEPLLMGEAVEEAEPVILGQLLSDEMDFGAVLAPPKSLPVAEAHASAKARVSTPDAALVSGSEPANVSLLTPPAAGSRAAARPASTSLPPGLMPRASPRVAARPAPPPPTHTPVAEALPPVRMPSGKWKALSAPITDQNAAVLANSEAPVTTKPASAAPPGLRPRRAEPQLSAGASALAFGELSPELGASLRASAGPSSFTKLEVQADSLLHAVELAAQAGLDPRAATSVADEEEVYSLADEIGSQGHSLNALPTVPLFSDLPRDAFIELFERCPLRRFGPGERIIEQGTHGDAFYVICEGSVRVFRMEGDQRQDLATLEGGACFGEMALLSGALRTASVEGASEDTQLLEISAPVLAELSRRYPLVAQALKKFCRQRLLTNVMNTSALFRPFNRKDRRTLVERFRARDVERDDIIIRDGEQTEGLYVVLSGEVEVRKDGHLLTRLKEGDLFGEISLLQKTPATATVTAARHTTLLRLPRADFDMLISSHPQILVLISELSDERLLRSERVLGTAAAMHGAPAEDDETLILV